MLARLVPVTSVGKSSLDARHGRDHHFERLRLELDRDLYAQESVKTQVAPIDVHVGIVERLTRLASEFEELAAQPRCPASICTAARLRWGLP